MPFTPIANTVESTLIAQREGRQRLNVIHWNVGTAVPSTAELEQLNDEILAGIIDKQKQITCLGTAWTEVRSVFIETASGSVVSNSAFIAGTGGTQVFPGNVSHCLTKRTALRGRSFRGRFFLFDLSEDYFNGDTVNPGYLPAITALANELLLERVGGLFKPAVASRLLQGSQAIQEITFDQVADTQSRRLTGRGR